MWMLIFWVLPLLAIIYVAWHVWTLLPLAGLWKSLIILVGVLCVGLLFMNFGRKFELGQTGSSGAQGVALS